MAIGKKTGGGSRKGRPNKIPGSVRAAVWDAFIDLGGTEGMVQWAASSPQARSEFYKLAGKLIPTEITGEGGGPVVVEVVRINQEKEPTGE